MVEEGAVVAHADHRPNDGVVAGLEVVANLHIAVDDRAQAQDGVAANAGRAAVLVVAEADGNAWLDEGVFADGGVLKLTRV